MPEQIVCTVVSIVPFELREFKPGLTPGSFHIPACDNENEPQVLHVSKALHYVYIDDTRGSLQVRDSPDEVCNAIVDDYITSQLAIKPDAKPGLIWLHGEWTSKKFVVEHSEKIKEMRQLQRNWLVELCKMADNDWNKYHTHQVVSDIQRKAAHIIQWKPEEHEWMSPHTAETGARCPACGTLNSPGIIVCPTCRNVLDKEKYKTLQFA